VVPIFTYRDERKLFALIGVVIVAALVALLQVSFARQGRTSPLTSLVTTTAMYFEIVVAAIRDGTRGGFDTVVRTPGLARENAALREENLRLHDENVAFTEELARVPAERDIIAAQARYPHAIEASVIGFDPENAIHAVTIDRGSKDGVHRDDGVVTSDGVVGRIVEVTLLSSKVLLVNDVTSRIPAVVQRGRWWSIAVGTQTRVKLQYVPQDAHLVLGDAVITGEGRSFHAGILVGRISSVTPSAAGALDQSAIVEPAVSFGRLHRVLVLQK
jgi:rod shape-determining protein MreC